MKTISQLAQLVRENKADQILGEVTESPAILTQVDDSGLPLGHLLALKKQLHLVEQQIDTDALETIWDKLGWTLAHTAAAAGSADVLKKVLQENHHLFYWGDDQGRTPVHVAAQHRHLDQFEIEVPYLTAMDALYSTPLHAAALNSSLHQVADSLTPEMLLVINLQGQSILDLAPELSETNESTPAKLRQTAWEARFIRDPERRTVESVLQHIGIRPK